MRHFCLRFPVLPSYISTPHRTTLQTGAKLARQQSKVENALCCPPQVRRDDRHGRPHGSRVSRSLLSSRHALHSDSRGFGHSPTWARELQVKRTDSSVRPAGRKSVAGRFLLTSRCGDVSFYHKRRSDQPTQTQVTLVMTERTLCRSTGTSIRRTRLSKGESLRRSRRGWMRVCFSRSVSPVPRFSCIISVGKVQ